MNKSIEINNHYIFYSEAFYENDWNESGILY